MFTGFPLVSLAAAWLCWHIVGPQIFVAGKSPRRKSRESLQLVLRPQMGFLLMGTEPSALCSGGFCVWGQERST